MTCAAPIRLVFLATALALAGCVERRFVIESNVPSAQVYIDNKPVGAAPANSQFEYYGYYNVTLVHPGYQSVTKRVHVVAPWYAYPPFDFFAEVLWPFHVEDVRRYYFEMQPATQARTDELISSADALRQRGWSLPTPVPANANPPVLQAPITPVPVDPYPAPAPPGGAAPPTTLIPSVAPSQYGPATGGVPLR